MVSVGGTSAMDLSIDVSFSLLGAEESRPFLISLKSIYNNWRIFSKGSCRASMNLSSSGETSAMVLSIAYSW
jgi:hypothetical protein